MQDFAFAFVELHDIPVSPFLQLFEIPLSSSLVQHIDHFLLFGIVCKTAERALYAIIEVSDTEIKWYWPSTDLRIMPPITRHQLDFLHLRKIF